MLKHTGVGTGGGGEAGREYWLPTFLCLGMFTSIQTIFRLVIFHMF